MCRTDYRRVVVATVQGLLIAVAFLACGPQVAVAGPILYWSENTFGPGTTSIVRALADGTGRQTIYTEPKPSGLDGFHALALDPRDGYIFAAHDQKIMRAGLDGSGATTLITTAASDIELDLVHGKVYWCSGNIAGPLNTGGIKRANLDGSNVETVVNLPRFPGLIEGLALDPLSGKLYYSVRSIPNQNGVIRVANLDGSNDQLFRANPGSSYFDPLDVEIDPSSGYLYWNGFGLNFSEVPTRRARLDGTGGIELLPPDTGTTTVTFLLDPIDQKLYLVRQDAGTPTNSLRRFNADGTGLEVLTDGTRIQGVDVLHTAGVTAVPEPTTLALFGLGTVAALGWTRWRRRRPHHVP